MLPHFLVILSAVFTTVCLNGILGAIVNLRGQIPEITRAEPVTPAILAPGGGQELHVTPSRERPAGTWYQRALDALAAPSWDGVIMSAILVLAAAVSSEVALFAELDIPLMIATSLVALVTLAATGLVFRARYRRSAWLPRADTAAAVQENLHGMAVYAQAVQAVPADRKGVADAPPRPPADEPSLSELEWYWVTEPFSYIKIQRTGTEGFVYTVYEPPITPREKTILQETYAHLRDIIVYDATEADLEEKFTDEKIHTIIREFDPLIRDDRLGILTYYLRRDLSGYGPLDVLMHDPSLEDLSCNGWDLPVFIFHKVYGSLPTSVIFRESELNQFVLKLAQKANKQVSLSNPMIDATLPDGARVQITYSNVVSTKGSSFTIRKFRADPMTPLDLVRLGTYSPQTLAYLWLAIEHHKSLLVVGGTASGKTSTMNAVSLFIPQNAKIVSLEDTREIQLPHRNWLPTQTRELSTEGVKGDIDLFALLKACMRQRPEYIIVGEVRGREAQTLFQAMNTGHATLSTIHAGTVQEAINRLTHDPINVPPVMFQALDLVVVQSIFSLGKQRIRRNMAIHEISVSREGEVTHTPLFEWDIHNDNFRKVHERSRVMDEIAAHCGWSTEDLDRELKKREEFFELALRVNNPTIHDLANAIHDLGE